MRAAAFVLLLSVVSCSNVQGEDPSMAPEEKARAHLEKLLKNRQFPGIQYLVLNRTGVVFEFNGGRRDTGTHAKVTAETSFMSASSTKSIPILFARKARDDTA